MRLGIVTTALVAGLVFSAAAYNAVLNLWTDDNGTAYLNGEEIPIPKRTDPEHSKSDTVSVPISLAGGTNVLAVRVRNHGWGGGMCASIDLNPVGRPDTMRSDAGWKATHVPQEDDSWLSASFDDSEWYDAGDFGPLADDTGGNPMNVFLKQGTAMAPLFYHGAHWIYVPRTCYHRTTFEAPGGTAAALIRGNNFTHKMWINGKLVGESDEIYNKDQPATRYSVELNEGANVVAVAATDMVGNDVILKCGVRWSQTGMAMSDETWKASFDTAAGWTGLDFDDSDWPATGAVGGFDNLGGDALTEAKWIWPNTICLRTTFDLPALGAQEFGATLGAFPERGMRADQVVRYTLQGKRLGRCKGRRPGGAGVVVTAIARGSNADGGSGRRGRVILEP